MEDPTVRDQLALERTHLANERTFLAYVRTALAPIAGSAVLFQYFSNRPSYLVAAWLLMIGGGLALTIGLVRFLQVRKHLRKDSAAD